MSYERTYWRKDPDAPFAELLNVVETMCHPEVSGLYDELITIAQRPEPTQRMRLFKEQLRSAIQDPGQLPSGALFDAARYDDGNDEKFLRRLWHDLYPNEALPAAR